MSQPYRTRMELHTILSKPKHADKVDMRFKYVPAMLTDISETFERVRKQLKRSKSGVK